MDNFKVTKSTNEKRRSLAFLVALLILETGSFKEETLAIDQRNRTPAQNNTSSISRVLKTRTEMNVVEIDGKDTVLKASATGKDVLDISTPNANGISHNKFKELSIGRDEGIIFNNSTVNGKSVIGGGVLKNLNLEKSAKVILNEVTGNTPSTINGTVEVFGDKADFILANENGIIVNNANFINTSGLTLTTGKVSVNDSKFNFDIKNGKVTLNGIKSDGDYFDVYAKVIEMQKEISSDEKNKDITIITGENTLEVSGNGLREVSILSSKETPEKHGVSGTEFGAMHGQNIKLISTDLGLGVKHEGLIFSLKDIKINSNGDIVFEGKTETKIAPTAEANKNTVNNRTIIDNRDNNTIQITGRNTKLKKSGDKVDVVDIKTPNSDGVSHNKFKDFSVGIGNGVIFNNSTKDRKSVIGGNVSKNPHLKGTSAKIILSEVTGKTPSKLNGAIEVFGDKADFILANKNGIMVNNTKFINANGATLTTGKVSLDKSKVNFDIKNGDIILGSLENNGDYFNVYAKFIGLRQKISAENSNINMISGKNILQGNSKELEKVEVISSKKRISGKRGIYGTELGTMYGRNIRLIGSDSIIGIKHAGSIFSTEDIKIDSKGTITLKDVKSQGKLEISGKNVVLEKKDKNLGENGNISANKDIKIEATHSIINNGKISGNGNIDISGKNIFNNRNSSISAGKDLELTVQEKISNGIEAALKAKGKKELNAPEIK